MTDTFFNICRHVIEQPTMNINIDEFRLEVLLNVYANEKRAFFYQRFFRPCIYDVHKCKKNKMKMGHEITRQEKIQIKFKCFENIMTVPMNLFAQPSNAAGGVHIIEEILDIYTKCQRHYHAFLRFAHIIKYKYSLVKNTCDLMLMPISEKDRGVYSLIEGNTKHVFRVHELRQIILSSISHTDDYFPDLLDLKNPYNNATIRIDQLYNFYFYMKTHNYAIDELVHAYFLSGFDESKYIEKYEILIRDRAIETAVKTSHHDKLYSMVLKMLMQYKSYVKTIQISCGFPKQKLVEIMRPYLLLYYNHLHYAQDFPKRYESEELLKTKLQNLYVFNPSFGQRTVVCESDIAERTIVRYNCSAPEFYKGFNYSMKHRINDYVYMELPLDIQYEKMKKIIGSAILTENMFHSTRDLVGYEHEDEYEHYLNMYYARDRLDMLRQPIRRNNSGRNNRLFEYQNTQYDTTRDNRETHTYPYTDTDPYPDTDTDTDTDTEIDTDTGANTDNDDSVRDSDTSQYIITPSDVDNTDLIAQVPNINVDASQHQYNANETLTISNITQHTSLGPLVICINYFQPMPLIFQRDEFLQYMLQMTSYDVSNQNRNIWPSISVAPETQQIQWQQLESRENDGMSVNAALDNTHLCQDTHVDNADADADADEDEDEDEDHELATSSILTQNMNHCSSISDEYLRARFEEMRREEYLEMGFTEEEYADMRDTSFHEYGSDGECEDW